MERRSRLQRVRMNPVRRPTPLNDSGDSVRLYSVKDAAERLSMSERWLYVQIAAGRIPVVELGGTRAKTRVRADDLQAFIDSRTHGRSRR